MRVGRDFAGGVVLLQGADLAGQRREIMELFVQQIGDRLLLVDRQGKNIGQDGGFGEAGRRLEVNVQFGCGRF